MENGYYGHTKGRYYEEFEEYLNTDPYYFKVENNKIADCVFGWDDLADSEEAKEESIRLKQEFMGKDATLIEQILGKEYTKPCPEEAFTDAKEEEMKRFDLHSEKEYQKFIKKTLKKDIENQAMIKSFINKKQNF